LTRCAGGGVFSATRPALPKWRSLISKAPESRFSVKATASSPSALAAALGWAASIFSPAAIA
jgi:hypothetical protein